jgi:2'-5' RNA ligase
MEKKRLFLSMEIVSPWPNELPEGRVLLKQDRHMTLCFIGDAHLPEVKELLETFPKPPFEIGLAGFFQKPLFLPPRRPNVAAWEIQFLEQEAELRKYQGDLVSWLRSKGLIQRKKRERFLPHATIARRPFSISEWRRDFHPLPLYGGSIHLCESLGESRYEVCWRYAIASPFIEIEQGSHTAFTLRGKSMEELHLHAELALSFRHPLLLKYVSEEKGSSIEEMIDSLNQMIARADAEIGCPFKEVRALKSVQGTELLELEIDLFLK